MSTRIGDTNIALSMPSQIGADDIAHRMLSDGQLASLGESFPDAGLVNLVIREVMACFEHQVELFSLLANRNFNLAIHTLSMPLPHISLHLVVRT